MTYQTALGPVSTKALADFIRREGPDGTGRVVAISIEKDGDWRGVFIYTVSAQWCDDSGSGTFSGPSETAAIRAFLDRVQPGNGCETYPGPADGCGPCTCDACTSGKHAAIFHGDGRPRAGRWNALEENETGVTVWQNAAPEGGRPIARLERPRMYGDSGIGAGFYRLVDTDGRLIQCFAFNPSVSRVRAALASWAETKAAGLETARNCMDAAAMDRAADRLENEARDLEERARDKGRTRGAVIDWNCAAWRRARVAIIRKFAAQERAAELAEPEERAPRSLSAAATPADLRDGYPEPGHGGAFPRRAVDSIVHAIADALADALDVDSGFGDWLDRTGTGTPLETDGEGLDALLMMEDMGADDCALDFAADALTLDADMDAIREEIAAHAAGPDWLDESPEAAAAAFFDLARGRDMAAAFGADVGQWT